MLSGVLASIALSTNRNQNKEEKKNLGALALIKKKSWTTALYFSLTYKRYPAVWGWWVRSKEHSVYRLTSEFVHCSLQAHVKISTIARTLKTSGKFLNDCCPPNSFGGSIRHVETFWFAKFDWLRRDQWGTYPGNLLSDLSKPWRVHNHAAFRRRIPKYWRWEKINYRFWS